MKAFNITEHRLYSTWKSMKNRCDNPNNHSYDYYGGKGVKVCDRWLLFENFLTDMEDSHREGLTLDRKDGNGNYCKENCRWATYKEQSNNADRDFTKILYNNLYYTEADLSNLTGIPRTTLQARRDKGYSDEEIVSGRCLKKYCVNGIKYNLKELAVLLKTSSQNLHQRLQRKSLEDILNELGRV